MNYRQIKKIIETNEGKFFTAEFIKQDGTLRVINCQYRGTPEDWNNKDKPHYVAVYDLQKKGLRTLNLSTVKKLKMAGIIITFDAPVQESLPLEESAWVINDGSVESWPSVGRKVDVEYNDGTIQLGIICGKANKLEAGGTHPDLLAINWYRTNIDSGIKRWRYSK